MIKPVPKKEASAETGGEATSSSSNEMPSINLQPENLNGVQGEESSSSAAVQSSETKNEKSLHALFEDLMKDTYSAEKQLIKALPKFVKAAYTEELEEAFERHLEQTKKHAERLEKIFTRLQIQVTDNQVCEAMKGLIKESEQVVDAYTMGPIRDSALIIGAKKIEHYEIAAYGSLCELADVLGWQRILDLLSRTLHEEEKADSIFGKIAMNVNDDAADASDFEQI